MAGTADGLSVLLKRNKDRSFQEDGNSQLHAACYYGDYDSALMLLLANHSTSVCNVWGETPIHQCTAQGHLDVMLLLLDSGANVNATDKDSYTPLHHAVIRGNRDASELLLCYGAQIFISDGLTRSPLELSEHVHVCHGVLNAAVGRVWSLQHLCRIVIRRCLSVARRRRIKELPLPRHIISFLTSLPVAQSDKLHANWERTKTAKAASVRHRQVSHRPRPGIGGTTSLQTLRGLI